MTAPLVEVAVLHTRMDCVTLAVGARQAALLFGWAERDAAELVLLVLELAGNAVRHGGGGLARLAVGPRRAEREVEDSGPGLPDRVLEGDPPPPRPGPGGLGAGLDCARRLADRLELENRTPCGARVWAARFPRYTERSSGHG